ncbi:hypothetical protein B296_00045977 [Ensete ventricosum]|uniref:Uncharacterized protein n=1 Tax=Ensete ventricosum TaxID=4639 RepID=A0A426WX01_ENSVE|nr:hypothetical protein B296_00045977 [Ensete ventricosum]
MVLQRRVFHVCTPKLASESLGHQHMGAMYHRGRSQIASTSESHGGDLIMQRYDQSGWRIGLLQCLREPDKSEDKTESEFDYSTMAVESDWEPKGCVACSQSRRLKIQQNARRCSVYSGFDEDVGGINGGEYHG